MVFDEAFAYRHRAHRNNPYYEYPHPHQLCPGCESTNTAGRLCDDCKAAGVTEEMN